jgi:hypothetical protein
VLGDVGHRVGAGVQYPSFGSRDGGGHGIVPASWLRTVAVDGVGAHGVSDGVQRGDGARWCCWRSGRCRNVRASARRGWSSVLMVLSMSRTVHTCGI